MGHPQTHWSFSTTVEQINVSRILREAEDSGLDLVEIKVEGTSHVYVHEASLKGWQHGTTRLGLPSEVAHVTHVPIRKNGTIGWLAPYKLNPQWICIHQTLEQATDALKEYDRWVSSPIRTTVRGVRALRRGQG